MQYFVGGLRGLPRITRTCLDGLLIDGKFWHIQSIPEFHYRRPYRSREPRILIRHEFSSDGRHDRWIMDLLVMSELPYRYQCGHSSSYCQFLLLCSENSWKLQYVFERLQDTIDAAAAAAISLCVGPSGDGGIHDISCGTAPKFWSVIYCTFRNGPVRDVAPCQRIYKRVSRVESSRVESSHLRPNKATARRLDRREKKSNETLWCGAAASQRGVILISTSTHHHAISKPHSTLFLLQH
jgi:hypothetical protein